jgi:hypothetical protein
MMYFCSPDAVSLMVELAQLGDWLAAELACTADVLRENELPAVADGKDMAPGLPRVALGMYAWRRGALVAALDIWRKCNVPEAAVLLAMTESELLPELALATVPSCREKHLWVAIFGSDGQALLAMGESREAGKVFFARGERSAGRDALLTAVKRDKDEAACGLLLSYIEGEQECDEDLLKDLALHCYAGQVALGNYYLRHGMRNEAQHMYLAAGCIAAGHRLQAMDVWSAEMGDEMIDTFVLEQRARCPRFASNTEA